MAKTKFGKYIKECYDELIFKVSWPSWKELLNSTNVVFIASLIFALIVYMMDISFKSILEVFYKFF